MTTTIIKTFTRPWRQGLWLAALCLLALTACTEEWEEKGAGQTGRAIQITASMLDGYTTTKAVDPKQAFQKDDVIHVSAVFTLENPNTTSTTYACMKYDNGNWTASDGTSLNWPWNATKATFTAYYIPPVTMENNEVMPNNTSMSEGSNLSYNLSLLTADAVNKGTDPMVATYTDVPVESAVHLQFNHLFTKLTFVNLGEESNYTGGLKEGQKLHIQTTDLADSCIFALSEKALSHKLEPNKGYISGIIEKEGDKTYTATFLLPAVTAEEGIDYKLAFHDFSPYHIIPIKQQLKAGHHYSLDITKLEDSYWDESMKEEAWNKDQVSTELGTDDINAYLQAIRDGQEYRKNNIQILDVYTEDGKKVVNQLKDVDFNDQTFTPVNISTNIIFQGNGHKIKGLHVQKSIDGSGNESGDYQALFGINEGSIKNLVIEGAKTATANAKYVGTLVAQNTDNGTIENVRIEFNKDNAVTGTKATQYIGGLVGQNHGTIKGCTLKGDYFQVKIENQEVSENGIYIGGMTGSTATTGSNKIENCRIQAGTDASVSYSGNAANVRIGGLVGSFNGNMENCSSSLKVALSGAANGYAGGLIGAVEGGTLTKCAATGVLELSSSTTLLNGGGFAGYIQNATVKACYATGETTNKASNDNTPNASIGGFAGQLNYSGKGTTLLLNCYAIGEVPNESNGGFTAIACEKTNTKIVSTEIDKTKVSISNCFSKNKATAFIGNEGATLTNYHHNGKQGEAVTADKLNNKIPEGGLQWQDTPALYGTGIPYFIIK